MGGCRLPLPRAGALLTCTPFLTSSQRAPPPLSAWQVGLGLSWSQCLRASVLRAPRAGWWVGRRGSPACCPPPCSTSPDTLFCELEQVRGLCRPPWGGRAREQTRILNVALGLSPWLLLPPSVHVHSLPPCPSPRPGCLALFPGELSSSSSWVRPGRQASTQARLHAASLVGLATASSGQLFSGEACIYCSPSGAHWGGQHEGRHKTLMPQDRPPRSHASPVPGLPGRGRLLGGRTHR